MKRLSDFAYRGFLFAAPAILMSWVMVPIPAQQNQGRRTGIVDDWSHHHVIFSSPGTLMDAMMNGRRQEWERIVNNPRYRMQQLRRHAAWPVQAANLALDFPAEHEEGPKFPVFGHGRGRNRKNPLHPDWSVTLGSGNHGVAIDMSPAKFSFDVAATPSCTADFVVFPINSAANSNQADLLGVNNLYATTCTGTVPTVKFAYSVGTGVVQLSPVISEDGTKVAFIESVTGNGTSAGSAFHVLTLGTNGNTGCPSTTPCNGNASNHPAVPGTLNNAVDTKITMSGFVSDTRSAPYIDYDGDIAYVGDDTGKLHKFTGVFNGIPAEVTTAPWPFTVAAGITLTGPVFDGGASRNIFVGGSDGKLYCVTSAGAACPTASIVVGTGPILDAPIVDSTTEMVFAAANSPVNTIAGTVNLVEATTALGSPVTVNMGLATTAGNGTTDVYDGTFDNAYFTSVGTGHMYFCGDATGAATPTLYRVGFNSAGTMNSTTDIGSFQLVQTGSAGTSVDCAPLTEVFNTSQNKDYLFLGVTDHGFSTGTTNCANKTCVMSFSLPTASPFTFPTSANSTLTTNLGNHGMSGFIIDNVSGTTGASQLYFGNLQNNTGVQVSQSALQ